LWSGTLLFGNSDMRGDLELVDVNFVAKTVGLVGH